MTPTEVQVLSVASTSAVVGWLPADSALEHRVVVDDVARVVIRPGGYRCTVTGKKSSQSPGQLALMPNFLTTCAWFQIVAVSSSLAAGVHSFRHFEVRRTKGARV